MSEELISTWNYHWVKNSEKIAIVCFNGNHFFHFFCVANQRTGWECFENANLQLTRWILRLTLPRHVSDLRRHRCSCYETLWAAEKPNRVELKEQSRTTDENVFLVLPQQSYDTIWWINSFYHLCLPTTSSTVRVFHLLQKVCKATNFHFHNRCPKLHAVMWRLRCTESFNTMGEASTHSEKSFDRESWENQLFNKYESLTLPRPQLSR